MCADMIRPVRYSGECERTLPAATAAAYSSWVPRWPTPSESVKNTTGSAGGPVLPGAARGTVVAPRPRRAAGAEVEATRAAGARAAMEKADIVVVWSCRVCGRVGATTRAEDT